MRSRIRTITQVGGDGKYPLLALDHTKEAFIPALDNLANAKNQIERLSAIDRGVELCAGGEESSGLESRDGWMVG